jgi:hypothetical protein
MLRQKLSRQGASGQAIVEMVLVAPLLLLVVVNVLNFGGFFYTWISVANAARAAGDYMVMSDKSVGAPRPPDPSQVRNLVVEELATLPKPNTVVVRICSRVWNGSGFTLSCSMGAPGDFPNPPPEDVAVRPEASLYVMSWVDVRYVYAPFIPLFNFPGMGIYGTLPPTNIHRQVVMRMLQ